WPYTPAANAAAGLETLSDMLRIEANHTAREPAPAGGTAGATIPELLTAVQQAASAHNVTVRSVAPNPVDAQKITLGLHADFRDMMAFLGRLETFQVAIGGCGFAPGEEGGGARAGGGGHTAVPGGPPPPS